MGRAKDNITETGKKGIITRIDSLYVLYQQAINQAFLETVKSPAALQRAELLRAKIRNNCLDLQRINQDAMFRKSNAAQKIARRGSITLIMMTVLVLVLGISLSWGLSKRIVKPILKLKDATQKLAGGDYSIKLESESTDELGILSSEFDTMAAKLWEFNQFNLRGRLAEQKR